MQKVNQARENVALQRDGKKKKFFKTMNQVGENAASGRGKKNKFSKFCLIKWKKIFQRCTVIQFLKNNDLVLDDNSDNN